jgi:hypothetical protein
VQNRLAQRSYRVRTKLNIPVKCGYH